MSRPKLILSSLCAVVALLAISAIGASAASATCYRVAEKKTGRYETRATCENNGPIVAEGEWIKIKKLEGKLKLGEYCAEVEVAETGNYENNACTIKVAKKPFIKVKVPEYGICTEKAGAGTEPPVKWDDHVCNTQVKVLAERKWEWLPLAANQLVEGTSGESTLEGTIAGLSIKIKCATDKFRGEIEPKGASTGEITFETCNNPFEVPSSTHKLTAIANCSVPNIKFKFRDQLVSGNGAGPEEEFKPEAVGGTQFVEIEITGATCGLPKKNKVEVSRADGGVYCALPLYDVGSVTHEIVCTATGDEYLRFAGTLTSFYSTEKVKLANAWGWFAE